MVNSPTYVGLFAKYWAAGSVKTRLGCGIGDGAAAELYRCFVETLTHRLRDIEGTRAVHFWPPASRSAFEEQFGESWSIVPQVAGNLGDRMQAFFDAAFSAGHERVVLLGSDSPHVGLSIISDAFDLLETVQVVLGPSCDGGYYLLGARRRMPDIFDGIPWSTPDVWPTTTARLHELGLESGRGYAILPECLDVDDRTDLMELARILDLEPEANDPDLAPLRMAVSEALSGTA